VVLVGEGRAEEGHDPVAHDLIDRPFVPMDGLHHQFENGIEELARLLGISVGEQFHRALQVGEQDCYLLAFSFEGALGGEDLLGEVVGGVRLRGTEFRLRGGGCRTQRPAAATAELLATLVQETA